MKYEDTAENPNANPQAICKANEGSLKNKITSTKIFTYIYIYIN